MLKSSLPFADLEDAYDMIAAGIDTAGKEKANLFLAKFALALASQVGDASKVRAAIDASLKDLGQ
jgi:hypothetical protein